MGCKRRAVAQGPEICAPFGDRRPGAALRRAHTGDQDPSFRGCLESLPFQPKRTRSRGSCQRCRVKSPMLARVALAASAVATTASAQNPTTPAETAPSSVVVNGVKRAKVPFGVGERLEYEVRFGALRVGNAHMEVVALDNLRGRPAWHTAFWVQGGNFLYRVNDVYESWMDAETLSSLRFVQELEEGGKDTERRFEIYPERAVFVQTPKKPPTEEPSANHPLDDGSFPYFVRT